MRRRRNKVGDSATMPRAVSLMERGDNQPQSGREVSMKVEEERMDHASASSAKKEGMMERVSNLNGTTGITVDVHHESVGVASGTCTAAIIWKRKTLMVEQERMT